MAEMLKHYAQDSFRRIILLFPHDLEKDYHNDFYAFRIEVFKGFPFVTEANAMAFLNKPTAKVFKKDLVWIMAHSFQETSGKFAPFYGEARSSALNRESPFHCRTPRNESETGTLS